MKYLISITLILCSVVAYGQDLIVATSGDSLKCKIVEVKSDEIQFRFGTGGVISIPRNEVRSYQYNFSPAAPTNRNAPAKTAEPARVYETPTNVQPKAAEPESKTSVKYRPFYAALVLGGTPFGNLSIEGEDVSLTGTAIIVGLDFAYFFNDWLGAGLKLNSMSGNISYTDAVYNEEFLSCNDMVMFYGPALYGRWGKGKFAFTANAGIGGLNWSMTDIKIEGESSADESYSSLGGFLSAGVNCMFTRHFGMSFNMQSILGKINYSGEDIIRKPTGLGFSVGFDFRF